MAAQTEQAEMPLLNRGEPAISLPLAEEPTPPDMPSSNERVASLEHDMPRSLSGTCC